jgi:hypothetical protein
VIAKYSMAWSPKNAVTAHAVRCFRSGTTGFKATVDDDASPAAVVVESAAVSLPDGSPSDRCSPERARRRVPSRSVN